MSSPERRRLEARLPIDAPTVETSAFIALAASPIAGNERRAASTDWPVATRQAS